MRVKPLIDVDEAFAWDEGEGNRTREWWLIPHRRYFGRQARREEFEIDDEILTVFERFEVVWPLDIADMTPWAKLNSGRASDVISWCHLQAEPTGCG